MLQEKTSLFDKAFSRNDRHLVSAAFIYFIIKYEISIEDFPEYPNGKIIELLCQLYESTLEEVSTDYFQNQLLHDNVKKLLNEDYLNSVKENLANACVQSKTELSDWLFELLELLEQGDNSLYAPKLRKRVPNYPTSIEFYEEVRTSFEMLGEYLWAAYPFISQLLRQINLEIGFCHYKAPFLYQVRSRESFDGINIYYISNRVGISSYNGWVPHHKQISEIIEEKIENEKEYGVYFDTTLISVSSLVRSFLFSKKNNISSSLNIYKLIRDKLPQDYYSLSKFIEAAELDFVMQHEIGHIKTIDLMKNYLKTSFLVSNKYMRGAITEILADWYSLNVLFKSPSDNIKKMSLLLRYDDYISDLRDLSNEQYGHRLTEITIRAILDKKPIYYINKFIKDLETKITYLNEHEMEEWLRKSSMQAKVEIVKMYDNPPQYIFS